jgi:spore coat protein U-like protein
MSVAYFCNYSSSPANLSVHLVPSGGSANVLNKIYSNVTITAGDTLVVETEKIIFSSGDTLQANASANSAINATVSFTGV